jgi:hypothetical protein
MQHTHVSTRRPAPKIIQLGWSALPVRKTPRVPSVSLTSLFLGPRAITGSICVISWNGQWSAAHSRDTWLDRQEVQSGFSLMQPTTCQPRRHACCLYTLSWRCWDRLWAKIGCIQVLPPVELSKADRFTEFPRTSPKARCKGTGDSKVISWALPSSPQFHGLKNRLKTGRFSWKPEKLVRSGFTDFW